MPEPTTGPIERSITALRSLISQDADWDGYQMDTVRSAAATLLSAYGHWRETAKQYNAAVNTLADENNRLGDRAAAAEAAVQRVRTLIEAQGADSYVMSHALLGALVDALPDQPDYDWTGVIEDDDAPHQPDSDHYLTISAERGRLNAHITCTASHEALCRLDCAEPRCTQEEQPPHTDHDGTRVHPHRDAGLCRVVESIEMFDPMRSYAGTSGPVVTLPVDAYLTDDGPHWDLLDRISVQHSDNREPDTARQIRAGFQHDRRLTEGGAL